tara:strand:+ start:746 stop:979 length:234 start_codon:yes stop_codon:yes gene_type:complete
MTKFFILAFMLVPFPYDDLMIVQEPTFTDVNECETHVLENWNQLTQWLEIEFEGAPIKSIICVDEEVVKALNIGSQV